MRLDMPLKPLGVLFAAVCVLAATSASASQRLVVEKNQSTRVALNSAAGSVMVANPNIADVMVVDSRTIYIVGKGFGSSSVIVTDQMGRAMFDAEIVVTAARQGVVTVYKGLKPTLMTCLTVCTSEDSTRP